MSQSGVYSELKPVWWYARERKLPDAPKHVQIVLSDLCNQDCHFCAYRLSGYTSNELFTSNAKLAPYGHNNPKRWMDTIRAKLLLEEIDRAGGLAIQFTGGGEPTVHPDHEDIFAYALKLGLRCSLVSNGVRWSDHLIRDILPQFDWVRVSIDAGNALAYAHYRRTPQKTWKVVWGNVTELAEKLHTRLTDTVLGVGFVVTPQSYKEIPSFCYEAKMSGAHNARITAMFSPEDEKPFVRIYDRVVELIERSREQFESPSFRVYDNFGSRFTDLKQHAPDYSKCSYQYYTTYIGGDMQAYRCCVLAYNQRGKIKGGNLAQRPFDEFWRSLDRKHDMQGFDARGCERCQFNEKNRGLLYVMGKPEHKEWP